MTARIERVLPFMHIRHFFPLNVPFLPLSAFGLWRKDTLFKIQTESFSFFDCDLISSFYFVHGLALSLLFSFQPSRVRSHDIVEHAMKSLDDASFCFGRLVHPPANTGANGCITSKNTLVQPNTLSNQLKPTHKTSEKIL